VGSFDIIGDGFVFFIAVQVSKPTIGGVGRIDLVITGTIAI
jgi:hypothetical protein